MAIMCCCQSKMSAALRRIDRALHAAQNQSRQHRFLRRPFDLIQELLQLLPQKEQPEDKAEKEAAESALQGNEAENAAAAVQHENAYAKLGKAFINRLHLPNELIANASEVESIVNRIISVWEKVEARTADSAAEENAEESFADAADANAERLPLPLAGGLAQAPEADYETMSAEQFRTLRKQLKRAAMDGRRIRL